VVGKIIGADELIIVKEDEPPRPMTETTLTATTI